MAINKLFHLIIILIFLLLAPIGNANHNTPTHKKSSPFDFVKNLKGCYKGNNTKEVHNLKAYLHKFGYLTYLNTTYATNSDFDDILESAIKTYQENYHIRPSGIIDDETISKMAAPRCGVPDIINGTNYMRPRNENQPPSSSTIHTVSHYSFFQGNPKWPPTKTRLTYWFSPNVPAEAENPVARAFQHWETATFFTFSRAESEQNADIVIGFYSGDHGDGEHFDGPNGVLAHAFAPTSGVFHLDAEEPWSTAATPSADAIHLETVATHEIGHLLGLGHSSIEEAIMYATIMPGQVKNIQEDDIQRIEALYNAQN